MCPPDYFLQTVVMMSATSQILKKDFLAMLKYYVKTTEALKRLRSDQDGVVSFEYVIVAACIVAVVAAAFSNTGPIGAALTSGITAIGTALTTAVAGA